MILDARTMPELAKRITVFDIKTCKRVIGAVWVNDETAEWGSYSTFSPDLDTVTHKENRISIYLDRNLILFNEIDDYDYTENLVNTTAIENVCQM